MAGPGGVLAFSSGQPGVWGLVNFHCGRGGVWALGFNHQANRCMGGGWEPWMQLFAILPFFQARMRGAWIMRRAFLGGGAVVMSVPVAWEQGVVGLSVA